MGTMNISLPDSLRKFVDEQVVRQNYRTSSEYVRELIRRDQKSLPLSALFLQGATSPLGGKADAGYFGVLRRRVTTAKRHVRRSLGGARQSC